MTSETGVTSNGLPCLTFGSGPPLVVFPGLTMTNEVPTGADRYFQQRMFRALSNRFRIHVIGRRPGLPPAVTMKDLAHEYAEAISVDIAERVPLVGTSTGGSFALRFAVDHPDMVERMVVVAAGGRLSEHGRAVQRAFAYLIVAGADRTAWQIFGESLVATRPARVAMSTMLWALGPSLSPADPSDMVATVEAEDTFDVMDELGSISAPTLVIGGTHDTLNGAGVLAATADAIPKGELVLLQGKGHIRAAGSGQTIRLMTEFITDPSKPPH